MKKEILRNLIVTAAFTGSLIGYVSHLQDLDAQSRAPKTYPKSKQSYGYVNSDHILVTEPVPFVDGNLPNAGFNPEVPVITDPST